MYKKILFSPSDIGQGMAPGMNRLPTLYGIIAILLWSMSVALTRGLSETLGPFGAGAAIYSVSGILVWLVAVRSSLFREIILVVQPA